MKLIILCVIILATSTITPAVAIYGGIGWNTEHVIQGVIQYLETLISKYDPTSTIPEQQEFLVQAQQTIDYLDGSFTRTTPELKERITTLLDTAQEIIDIGIISEDIILTKQGEKVFRYTPLNQTFVIDLSSWNCTIESSILQCTQT